MNNKILLFLLTILFSPSLHAQLDFQWTNSVGGSLDDQAKAFCVDNELNVYVTGSFNDTVDFDPGTDTTYLISNGGMDIFICKFDSSGNFVWAKGFGGLNNDQATGISTDLTGYINIVGYIKDSVDVDPGPDTAIVIPDGTRDIFVSKFDANGNLLWNRVLATVTSNDLPDAITSDNTGAVYYSGNTSGTVDFDPGLTSYSIFIYSGACFVSKLDANGDFVYAHPFKKNSGATGHVEAKKLHLLADGSILTVGRFTDDIDFGPIQLNTSGILNGYDAYFAKLTPSGALAWVKPLQGHDNHEICTNINTDNHGNILVTGHYWGTTDFDPGPGVFELTSASTSYFVAKYDSIGNYNWVKDWYGAGFGTIDFDTYGNLYLGGTTNGYADLDPGIGIIVPEEGLLISKFTTTGNFVWTEVFEGSGTIENLEVIDNHSIFYNGNIHYSSVDFGIGSPYVLNPSGLNDFYTGRVHLNMCSSFGTIIDTVHNVTCDSIGYVSCHSFGGLEPYIYNWNTIPASNDSNTIITAANIYQVMVSDYAGCTSSRTIIINGAGSNMNYDLTLNTIAENFRPGFNTNVWIDAFNDGCIPSPGTLQIVYDSLLSITNITPPPTIIIGDTLFWNLPTLTYDSAHFQPNIVFYTSSSAIIGDTIDLWCSITPISGDGDSTDNFKHYKFPVINGYDPNDKQVYPKGLCDDHYVFPNEKLTYTIRFQNTGNADAINIHIIDTLDNNLDLNSIRINGNSHTLITEVLPGNVLKFRFDNIHLPDSGSNELLSHGFVIFDIMPDSNAILGSVVENTAHIFFDFNPAIVTNTVFNTIVDQIPNCYGLSLETNEWIPLIYPNPTHSLINISSLVELSDASIQVTNLGGQLLMEKNHVHGYNISLDLSELNQGMYFIHIYSEGKKAVIKVVKN